MVQPKQPISQNKNNLSVLAENHLNPPQTRLVHFMPNSALWKRTARVSKCYTGVCDESLNDRRTHQDVNKFGGVKICHERYEDNTVHCLPFF